MRRVTIRDRYKAALNRVHVEENWMAEHGGDLYGYVRRYGSMTEPEHHGDGGEAIYAADKAVLDRAQAEVDALKPLVGTDEPGDES
jgi:hypothetical protein